MARAKTITGAHLILYINGMPFSTVSEFSFSSQTMTRPAMGLDSSEPYELMPGNSKVTVSMTLYRLIGDGGLEGAGIVSPLGLLPNQKYLSIALIERSSDTVVFQSNTAMVLGQSWNVKAKAVMIGQVQIECLDWKNEASING